MLKIIVIVFVFLASYEAKIYAKQTVIAHNPVTGTKTCLSVNDYFVVYDSKLRFSNTTQSLIIISGKGKIIIHFNGKVELVGTSLDEASKEFWNKISKAFPSFKEKIIDEYRNTKGINGVIVSEP